MFPLNGLLLLVVAICAKNLHVKETNLGEITNTRETEGENSFLDFYNYDDQFYTEKQRYNRHAELVTESVLEHVLTEIKKKYEHTNSSSNIPELVRRLKIKMKLWHKKKLKKHRKKQLLHYLNSTNAPNLVTVSPEKPL